MKSKKWAILRLLTVVIALVSWLYVGFCCPNNLIARRVCFFVLAASLTIHLCAMYCPHCGTIGKLPCNLLSKKTCGRCKRCGELVYWKDSLD